MVFQARTGTERESELPSTHVPSQVDAVTLPAPGADTRPFPSSALWLGVPCPHFPPAVCVWPAGTELAHAPYAQRDARAEPQGKHTSGRLCPAVGSRAVGRKFNVSESTGYVKYCV